MTLTSCLHLLLSAVLAADPGASEAAKIYPYPDGVIQNIWHFNPEPGWWVLKDRPGTGFALERQGSDTVSDTYFLAMFTYDPDGRPTFYTMTGRYDYATKRLTGTFDRAEGGGVRLGVYRPPTVTVEAGGRAEFEFINEKEGIWHSPRGPIPIERFDFAFGRRTAKTFLGRWLIINVQKSPIGIRTYIVDFTEIDSDNGGAPPEDPGIAMGRIAPVFHGALPGAQQALFAGWNTKEIFYGENNPYRVFDYAIEIFDPMAEAEGYGIHDCRLHRGLHLAVGMLRMVRQNSNFYVPGNCIAIRLMTLEELRVYGQPPSPQGMLAGLGKLLAAGRELASLPVSGSPLPEEVREVSPQEIAARERMIAKAIAWAQERGFWK